MDDPRKAAELKRYFDEAIIKQKEKQAKRPAEAKPLKAAELETQSGGEQHDEG